MRIFNGTLEDINIIYGAEFDDEIAEYVGGEIIKTIPRNSELYASGMGFKLLEGMDPIDGIPVFDRESIYCDQLPKGYDVYIVSETYAALYVSQEEQNGRIFTLADPVFEEDGETIIGYRGISLF